MRLLKIVKSLFSKENNICQVSNGSSDKEEDTEFSKG